MKEIKKFLDSIYLGDRFCEGVEIKEGKILFQINCISRVMPGTNEWNYYADENVEHGYLVFDEVVDFTFNSTLPFNDEIYEISVIEKKDEMYSFIVYGCNISEGAVCTDIEMRIRAKKFYIYDPEENCCIME